MTRFLLISLTAILLPAADRDLRPTEPNTGSNTVFGVVTSAANGEPVPGVQVYLGDLNLGSLTSDSGRFSIYEVPEGEHELTVEHHCFLTVTVRLDDDVARASRRVDLGLPVRAPEASGDAEPLGGCYVFR